MIRHSAKLDQELVPKILKHFNFSVSCLNFFTKYFFDVLAQVENFFDLLLEYFYIVLPVIIRNEILKKL